VQTAIQPYASSDFDFRSLPNSGKVCPAAGVSLRPQCCVGLRREQPFRGPGERLVTIELVAGFLLILPFEEFDNEHGVRRIRRATLARDASDLHEMGVRKAAWSARCDEDTFPVSFHSSKRHKKS
jgi:hypothetical protein